MKKSPEDATIDWYMDTAREKARIVSDGKLSIAVGLNRVASNYWRAKKNWPSDATMVELAKLVDVDPRIALIDCKIWSAKDETVAATWRSIKSALKSLPLFLLLLSQKPAEAADFSHFSIVKSGSEAVSSLYNAGCSRRAAP